MSLQFCFAFFSAVYVVPLYISIISFSMSVLFSKRTHVYLLDLVKSFSTSIDLQYLKFGFDQAENESLKVCHDVVRQ